MDPCEDLSDEDIRIAIHNATGPRNALFVPEVHAMIVNLRIKRSTYNSFYYRWDDNDGISVLGPI